MAKRWEYLTARISVNDLGSRLESLGADGWELVTALPVQTYEYRDANHYGDKDWSAPVAVNIHEVDCIFKRETRKPEVARG